MNEEDELLQHKFFDKNIDKKDVDIVLSDSNYLTIEQENRKKQLEAIKESGIMRSLEQYHMMTRFICTIQLLAFQQQIMKR